MDGPSKQYHGIVSPESIRSSPLASTLERLTISPLSLVLILTALVCLFTRVRTEIQHRRQSVPRAEPKEGAILPYWLPWLGHTIQVVARNQKFFPEASRTSKDGVFRILIAGNLYSVVGSPSLTNRIHLQRSNISADSLVFRFMEKVFGNKGGIRSMDPHLLHKQHQIVAQLSRDPFMSKAAAATVNAVQDRIYNLVSFSRSWVDQSNWERVANVSVDPSGTSAEASFFPLMRYFVGDIACGILMGQDFMANNPDILLDLFTFDFKFNQLFAGFPHWFPGMAPAYQARSRLLQAVREHQEALYAVWEDRDPGPRWNDLSDVSNVMQERARAWRSMHADPDDFSTGDTSILWAMNANANQLIFWQLYYIYQRPDLRAELMEEIRPYVTMTAVKSDLPITEAPKVTINLPGLTRDCPLLKATFFETMRFEAPVRGIKSVTESFAITESVGDAAIEGKSQPQTYFFPKGTFLWLPYGVHSQDGRYWKDPTTFNPRRFFVRDEKDPAGMRVDMGTMKPFGGGQTICKGRGFAEREVLIFVAAMLTVWDVEPVGGKWSDPGRLSASGANFPKTDLRVRLKRRNVP